MPTYINLIRFTQKGVETIREGSRLCTRGDNQLWLAG